MSHDLRMLLVIVIWGLNYLILPHGAGPMGAGPFTLMRFAMTLPILVLLLWIRKCPPIMREDWPNIIVFGLVSVAGYQGVFAAAVQSTTTTNASVLFSLSPIFGVLIGVCLRRETPSALNVAGLLLAFMGSFMLIRARHPGEGLSSGHIRGDLLMLLAAVLWACAAYIGERPLRKYGGLVVTAWSLPAGLLGLSLWSGPSALMLNWVALPPTAWASLAFAAVFATAVGVVLFYDALPHIGSGRVMSYMYLTPAVAILASCLIEQRWLTWLQLAGVSMALVGVFLARHKRRPKPARSKIMESAAADQQSYAR